MDLIMHEPIAVAWPGGGVAGVYWIRIYRGPDAAVVIIADVPGNPGFSPTNAVSPIACQVMREFLPGVTNVRWFLCYPGGHVSSTTTYSEVRFLGPEMSPEWPKKAKGGRRRVVEAAICGPLHLLPGHDQVLKRVLAAGGSLDKGEPTMRYIIVPASELPPPRRPFRCAHAGRFDAYMRDNGLDPDREYAPREIRERFYQQLTEAEYHACEYHDADWRTIAGEAVRIVNELGETPDREALHRALATAKVRKADHGWLSSLFEDPMTWSGDQFVNGQHRSCALRASAAAAVVKAVDGPHGPPSTWTITDDA